MGLAMPSRLCGGARRARRLTRLWEESPSTLGSAQAGRAFGVTRCVEEPGLYATIVQYWARQLSSGLIPGEAS